MQHNQIDIVVHGDFQYQEGKRIGWEIEDGQTEVRKAVIRVRSLSIYRTYIYSL